MTAIVNILPWLQIGLSVILVILILIQRSEAGLGAAFGGGMSDTIEHKRRGSEKIIFQATIVVAVLFALSSLISLFI